MKIYFAILILITLTFVIVVQKQLIQNPTKSYDINKLENFEKGKLIYTYSMKRSDIESKIK